VSVAVVPLLDGLLPGGGVRGRCAAARWAAAWWRCPWPLCRCSVCCRLAELAVAVVPLLGALSPGSEGQAVVSLFNALAPAQL
ncbi:hypothetical protein, partial [Pseudoduganella danionis]